MMGEGGGCMRRRVGWRGRRHEEKGMEREEKREEVPYNT